MSFKTTRNILEEVVETVTGTSNHPHVSSYQVSVPLLSPTLGGTGLDTSTATGLPIINSGVWSILQENQLLFSVLGVQGNSTPTLYITTGTSGTATQQSIYGTCQSGVFSFTTGSSPSGSGLVAILTISPPFVSPNPVAALITANNANAAASIAKFYCSLGLGYGGIASINVSVTNGPLTASTLYSFNYFLL